MNIDDAIIALRKGHCPPPKPYTLPTEEAVKAAEQELGVSFHPDYRAFLLRASDVCLGSIEPCVLSPDAGHCDLVSISREAWSQGLDSALLPICQDNGDYYCMNYSGNVVLWLHDGHSNDSWSSLADWIGDVWLSSV